MSLRSFCILGLLTVVQSAFSKEIQSSPTQKQTVQTHSIKNASQVRGLILHFKDWPDEKQEIRILEKLELYQFQKTERLKHLKMWLLEWDRMQPEAKAKEACNDLSEFQSIKACEPDYQTHSEDTDTESCDLISSQFGLQEGKLSDYWAQRMIGSDLIKEELEKVEPNTKKLVQLFDRDKNQHGMKAKNLISDEGDHSVLPPAGDKVDLAYTTYNSDILSETNKLLGQAEQACNQEDLSSQESNPQNPPSQESTSQNNENSGNPDQDPSQQRTTIGQSSSDTAQETVTHNDTEYIMLSAWALNRNYELHNVINVFDSIQYVDNPHIEALKAAGESYSPDVHVVPNTEANKEKLEQFAQRRGTTVYNRNLGTVIWKTATDWSSAWKTGSGDQAAPPSGYDLTADYELDPEKNLHILARREYRYIFRPPVLDLGTGTSGNTSNFNWLPIIVLAPGNKLKIWGTREVGKGVITINGVSVTLTEVAGTVSNVEGSAKRHGRFEAVLSASDYNTVLNNGLEGN